MVSPSPEQLALLKRFERFAFKFSDRVNGVRALKRASHWFLRRVGAGWVHFCTRHLIHLEGIERARALTPPRGLLLVSNHRSFFDQYIISMVLFRQTELLERIFFPVRAEFFYERVLGFFINGLMSGWSMFPPVLRQPERSAFNKYTMARLVELLQEPGNVIGFHPEGTRNKTDDPYTLLPAQPGVGQLIVQAKPTVLPIFVHGMGNQAGHQIRSNFDRTGKKIIVVFGEPLDLERFYAQTPRLRVYMDVANFVRDSITTLGAKERAVRAALEPAASSPLQKVEP